MTQGSFQGSFVLGKNVNGTVKDAKLTIEIDLNVELGESKSKKSILIATTGGAAKLPDGSEVSLNVYRQAGTAKLTRGK